MGLPMRNDAPTEHSPNQPADTDVGVLPPNGVRRMWLALDGRALRGAAAPARRSASECSANNSTGLPTDRYRSGIARGLPQDDSAVHPRAARTLNIRQRLHESKAQWLLEWPGINVALNRAEPLPRSGRGLLGLLHGRRKQTDWGGYANGIALELAVRLIRPSTPRAAVLHMDAPPCHRRWLSFPISKLSPKVAAPEVRMDRMRTPEGVPLVLGFVVDFQLFKRLGLSFLPSLPQCDWGTG